MSVSRPPPMQDPSHPRKTDSRIRWARSCGDGQMWCFKCEKVKYLPPVNFENSVLLRPGKTGVRCDPGPSIFNKINIFELRVGLKGLDQQL